MYGNVKGIVRRLVKSAFGDAVWDDIHTQVSARKAFVAMLKPVPDDSGSVNTTAKNMCFFIRQCFAPKNNHRPCTCTQMPAPMMLSVTSMPIVMRSVFRILSSV